MISIRRRYRGLVAAGFLVGSLASLPGCGGSLPEEGSQVKDTATPTKLEGIYKNQPKSTGTGKPKYDTPR